VVASTVGWRPAFGGSQEVVHAIHAHYRIPCRLLNDQYTFSIMNDPSSCNLLQF
jgi:hypothetical protein